MSERYETAKQRYQEYGVDVEAALDLLKGIPISVHCLSLIHISEPTRH